MVMQGKKHSTKRFSMFVDVSKSPNDIYDYYLFIACGKKNELAPGA